MSYKNMLGHNLRLYRNSNIAIFIVILFKNQFNNLLSILTASKRTI